jgi:hypothetical protein
MPSSGSARILSYASRIGKPPAITAKQNEEIEKPVEDIFGVKPSGRGNR